MERLTFKYNGHRNAFYRREHGDSMVDVSPDFIIASEIQDVLNKLSTYEDAEEQGMLIKLPCKVGDTVYRIEYVVVKNHNFNYEIGISDRKFNLLLLDEFGKTVFLTREEAEAALKGENNG